MNKDQKLIAEAYEAVLEANLVQNAFNTGRYAVSSLVNKGKNALGIKVSPRNYGEGWDDWANRLGIETPPFGAPGAFDKGYDKAAQEAWNKKYPAAAAYIAAERKKDADKRAYEQSPEGKEAARRAEDERIAAANRQFRRTHIKDETGKWV